MTQLFMIHPGPLLTEPPSIPGVRVAVADDARPLAALLSEAFDEVWDELRVRAELLDAPDVPVTWVLESTAGSGGLSATASERLLPQQYPGVGYVHWVAVATAEQGRGLGTSMTARAMAGFAARGLTGAVLETDDFRRGAVVSYLRLGFVPSYRDDAEVRAWSALLASLLPSRRPVAR